MLDFGVNVAMQCVLRIHTDGSHAGTVLRLRHAELTLAGNKLATGSWHWHWRCHCHWQCQHTVIISAWTLRVFQLVSAGSTIQICSSFKKDIVFCTQRSGNPPCISASQPPLECRRSYCARPFIICIYYAMCSSPLHLIHHKF